MDEAARTAGPPSASLLLFSRILMKVGIFWYYRSAVIGATNELSEAFDGGDFIDSPLTHNRHWEVIQRQVPGLRFSEYIEVPRGRVLYDKRQEHPLVYMDRVLFKLAIQRKICAFFDLPEAVTEFERDAHYTTDRDDLRSLFEG